MAFNSTEDAKSEFCSGDCPSDIGDIIDACSNAAILEGLDLEKIETGLEGKCSRVGRVGW